MCVVEADIRLYLSKRYEKLQGPLFVNVEMISAKTSISFSII